MHLRRTEPVTAETVRSIMQRQFTALSPETDIYEAIELIAGKGLMGAPVVSPTKDLLGVFAERDCLALLANWTLQVELETGGTVADFMRTKDVLWVEPDMSITAAIGRFVGSHHRGLPVVEEGKVVGLISRRELLLAVLDERDRTRLKGQRASLMPGSWRPTEAQPRNESYDRVTRLR